VIAVIVQHASSAQPQHPRGSRPTLRLRALIGSGDRIAAFVLPFVVVGILLNVAFPDVFGVGGPPRWLGIVAAVAFAVGVAGWAWSVGLILTKMRVGQLVTSGPYALVKHPLYTAVALLVLPSLGILLDTWLGVVVGLALYTGSRLFAPAEEVVLAERFGRDWDIYRDRVRIRWL
jgi:protein-S-isoprenylcysteine O-methyltransferase Ste14